MPLTAKRACLQALDASPLESPAEEHHEDAAAATGGLLSAAAVSSVRLVKMRLLRMLFVAGMLRESLRSVSGQRGRTSSSPSAASLETSQRPSRNLQRPTTTWGSGLHVCTDSDMLTGKLLAKHFLDMTISDTARKLSAAADDKCMKQDRRFYSARL